jgi:hypothetical protein
VEGVCRMGGGRVETLGRTQTRASLARDIGPVESRDGSTLVCLGYRF